MTRRPEGQGTRAFGRARSAVALLVGAVVAASSVAVATPAPARAATTLQVNGDASTTNKVAVTLTFGEVSRTPIEVVITNDPGNSVGVLMGETRPWSPSITWSLDATQPDGERFVYAQLRYSESEWSDVMADGIWLDRTGPKVTVAINGNAPYLGDPWDWQGGSYTFDDVTLDMQVTDAGPGFDPTGFQVSRDGVTWENRPFYGWQAWGTYSTTYNLIGGNWNEGPRSIWVKWRDAAGNWSAPATDSITVRYESAGRVVVDGGVGYADSFLVKVQVPVDVMPAEGVATVHLSSNYLGCSNPPFDPECATRAYTWSPNMVIDWDMRDTRYLGSTKEGHRRVLVWFRSKTGRVAHVAQQGFVIDTQPAVTGPPRPTVAFNTTVTTSSSSNVSADIRWSSNGTGSPVAANQLQQSTNASSWGYVALAKPLATSAPRSLTPGAGYRFRTRSQDAAGNWGTWAYGATFGVAPTQQASTLVKYYGTWTTASKTDAWGGSYRYARTKGASATMTFTGRGIAVIAPRTSNGGELDIYLDGKLVNTAYLRSNVHQPRRVIYTTSWTSSATHTIRVVKKYDNRDFPVYLDGFLVLK